jgi:hypothetical protein
VLEAGDGRARRRVRDEIPIATLQNPVTLPAQRRPIPADTPPESGPVILYNWADYLYHEGVHDFEDKFGVKVEVTTFNNLEEGIAKVVNGQITPDVFVPTPGYLRRLVAKDLLQPLQHDLIPNMVERLAHLLRPRPLLRPGVAVHRPVHDLFVGRGVPQGSARLDARGGG